MCLGGCWVDVLAAACRKGGLNLIGWLGVTMTEPQRSHLDRTPSYALSHLVDSEDDEAKAENETDLDLLERTLDEIGMGQLSVCVLTSPMLN